MTFCQMSRGESTSFSMTVNATTDQPNTAMSSSRPYMSLAMKWEGSFTEPPETSKAPLSALHAESMKTLRMSSRATAYI